jgi:hypothetical protein
MPDLPVDVEERAMMLTDAVKKLQKRVPSPSFPDPSNLGAQWPLCDRDGPLEQIKEAVKSNASKQREGCVEKQHYQCVVITGAAGSGKTRLCHEGMRAVAAAERSHLNSQFSTIYEVFITFLNGEQITPADAVGDTLLEQAGVALGIRVACQLFPQLKLCSPMPLESFRAAIQRQVDLGLLDLRTVMRVCARQHPGKKTMVLLTLDESYYAEEPKDARAPRLWPQIMTKLLEYVIPGEKLKPQLNDGVLLFPILSSTWSAERTKAYISPVDKVCLDLVPLSRDSLFNTICTPARLGNWLTPAVDALLKDARFQSFLLSCAQAPRAVAAAIECVSPLQLGGGLDDAFRATAVKQVCLKMHDFYKRNEVHREVLELALSGVCLPQKLEDLRIGDQAMVEWLAMGFATGAKEAPISVPFPLLYSKAGVLVPGLDQFLNWGQPFHWQDFEALVPHIIRLRCSSLYRLKENHQATLAEIFGSGPDEPVVLRPTMAVVTCSKQWLVPKRRNVKTVAQQLKVTTRDSQIEAGLAGMLNFGSLAHIFAATDGNVHFDGHLSFTTVDGRLVLGCYQVKHTHIINERVAHFTWAQVEEWLKKARAFMAGYVADVKLFVMITNKEVRDAPGNMPPDFVVIHQRNLGSFFAPCLLASAMLAPDDPIL